MAVRWNRFALAITNVQYIFSGTSLIVVRYYPEPDMRTVALYEMLFGLITVVGGVIGFVTADSMESLIAGGAAGLALLFTGFTMQKGSRTGMYIALVISLLLLGQFGRKFFFIDGTPFMPAGLMSIMSIISLILIVLVLVQPKERKRIF